MMRLFVSKTELEESLVKIIKNDPLQKNRFNALKKLRIICNDNKKDVIPSLQISEVYQHINGKPVYFRRFLSATIEYDDTKLLR